MARAARRWLGGDTPLVVVKSTVAATVAWVVASVLLQAPNATFAPFSAVLLMYATVSRALDHALRYTAAMLGGVLVAGVLAPLLGPGWSTFALIVLLALVLGQWRRLGSHGSQVAVAAMFAYAALTQSGTGFQWSSVASIVVLVLLGCVVAIVINIVLVPPLRYRGSAAGPGHRGRRDHDGAARHGRNVLRRVRRTTVGRLGRAGRAVARPGRASARHD